MSDIIFTPGRIIAVEAMANNLFDSGIIPLLVDDILSPFGSSTDGQDFVCLSVRTFFLSWLRQ